MASHPCYKEQNVSTRIALAVLAATGIGIASCEAGPAGPSLAPPVVALDEVSVKPIVAGGPSIQLSATEWFVDPANLGLAFEVESNAEGVVRATVSGSTVSVEPVAAGAAEVTVSATNSAGLPASISFVVVVMHSTTDDRAALVALYDSTGGAS